MPELDPRRSVAWTRLVAVLVGAVLACTAAEPSASAGTVPDGHVTGRVTNHAGAPIAGVEVVPYRLHDGQWLESLRVTTAADGSYDARVVPGTYRMWFQGSGGYLGEYFSDAYDVADAANVTVAGDVAGVDAELDLAASARGLVRDRAGILVSEDVEVTLYRRDGRASRWSVAARSATRGGVWQLDAIRPGTYRLGFSDDPDPSSDDVRAWATQFYPDVLGIDQADDIRVGEGDRLSVDVALHEPSHVTGHVTVPPGATVVDCIGVVARAAPDVGSVPTSVMAGSDGYYDLGGLDPGDYVVQFVDICGAAARQYFSGAATLGDAQVVTVGRDTTVPDVTVELVLGSELAGRVTSEDGVGAYHAVVTVYEPFRGSWRAAVTSQTEGDGTWVVEGLPAGTYRVGVDDRFFETLESEFYEDATSVDGARDLVLGPDSRVAGVDLALAPAGSAPPSPTPSPPPSPSAPIPLPPSVAPAGQHPVVSVIRAPFLPRTGLRAETRVRIVPGVYGPGTAVTYRWFADGRPVRTALGPSLKVTTQLLGMRIRVRETAVLAGAAPVRTLITFKGRVH